MRSIQHFDILVVDDEPNVIDMLLRAAQTVFPEATFVCTPSPQQALAYLDQQAHEVPHLVLLDIDLKSATNGLELLPEIYARLKGQVPVIMLTSTIDQKAVYQAYDRGAVAYFEKPLDWLDWKDFAAALRAFLVAMYQLRLPNGGIMR